MTTPTNAPVTITQQNSELADLANTIAAASTTDPNSTTTLKGVVTAVNLGVQPPSASVTLSGDPTVVESVLFMASYTPTVGDVVQVQKQGATVWIVGQLMDGNINASNGWVDVARASGVSNGANAQGNWQMRVIVDNGERCVQLRGGIGLSGQTTVGTIPTGMLPVGSNRTLLCPRDGDGGTLSVQVYFNANGSIVVEGGTLPSGPPSTVNTSGPSGGSDAAAGAGTGSSTASFSGSTTPTSSGASATSTGAATAGTAHTHGDDHTHSVSVSVSGTTGGHTHTEGSHSHGLGGHVHSLSNHDHTVVAPIWVGFNSLYYFISDGTSY